MLADYGSAFSQAFYLAFLGILFSFPTVRIITLWLYQEMEEITLGLLILVNLILAVAAVLLQPWGIALTFTVCMAD